MELTDNKATLFECKDKSSADRLSARGFVRISVGIFQVGRFAVVFLGVML